MNIIISQHRKPALWLIAFVGIALSALTSAPAHATENGGTTYPLGVFTINPGFAPPPDRLSFYSYNSYYVSDTLESSNPRKPTDFHLWTAVSAERFDFSWPMAPIAGFRFGSRVIIPFVELHQTITAAGRTRTQSQGGLGDVSVAPLLLGRVDKTSIGTLAQQANLTISLPTGAYEPNNLVNPGRNYTAYQWNYGLSLLPTPDTQIGFQAVYISNTRNDKTNYRSGDEFDIDWVAGYQFTKGLWAEANGYYYTQLTNDRQNGALFNNGNQGQVFAYGPQLRWAWPHGGGITTKWQHETDVDNRARGDRFWLQLYIPLIKTAPRS
jgi:hypothetical protein